jgi:GT2 family glycosyltransferase
VGKLGKNMISIVTGTLNREHLIPHIIKNTVDSSENVELILVDGGELNNETSKYIKNLNHPRIKLIEFGARSSYPHFMNLGINHAKYDWVCQWNDDCLLSNNWDDVIKELTTEHDFYLFNWKYGNIEDLHNENWLDGEYGDKWWFICDNYDTTGHIVVNYGIYNKKIFKEIGMYNNEFKYYFADADMTLRAFLFGYKYKVLRNIKVLSLNTDKQAIHYNDDERIYEKNRIEYKNKILNKNNEFLK